MNNKNVKKSKYNIIVPRENGEHIIYNPISGAIGIFDSDVMKRFSTDLLTDAELSVLISKGIYVPNSLNELDFINRHRIEGMFSSKKQFRIWSTSDCNARCYYCFEKGIKPEQMTLQTADAIINFICELVSKEDSVSIEWFGGEPLMNMAIIDYISKKLQNAFEKKSIPWESTMISNGSLITPGVVKKMKDFWNIKKVQITLDGYMEKYDCVKNYTNTREHNFFAVIQNIKHLTQNGIKVSIRMNYDTTNYNTLKELILFLHNEFQNEKNISYYIYPVWGSLGKCDNPFITNTQADLQLIDLFEELVKNGMASTIHLARLRYRKRQCSACGINNYSFLPNGDILKCSEAFNNVIGNVWVGINDEITAAKWTDPSIDEDCKTCLYLPLCQGGCRASRTTTMPRCMAFKDILPKLLEWHVAHNENNKKSTDNI